MNKPPLFFLHFPRTAGTTVDEIFFNNFPAESILSIYSQDEFKKYRYIDEETLSKIQYITGHLILSSVAPPQFYGKDIRAFTFLRDPVKRLYSEYIFLKSWEQQHLYTYLNSNNISFSQYIESNEQILKYRGKNFMTRCLSGDSLENSDIRTSLEKAKYNLQNYFIFFGIQEKFMESMLLLSYKAGLKNILHNKRNYLNYNLIKSKITPYETDLAIEYNKADIELYNFAYDLFNQRIKEMGPNFARSLKNYKFLNSKYQNISNILYENVNNESGNDIIKLSKDINWN